MVERGAEAGLLDAGERAARRFLKLSFDTFSSQKMIEFRLHFVRKKRPGCI